MRWCILDVAPLASRRRLARKQKRVRSKRAEPQLFVDDGVAHACDESAFTYYFAQILPLGGSHSVVVPSILTRAWPALMQSHDSAKTGHLNFLSSSLPLYAFWACPPPHAGN